jgi:hypothetical protein
LTFVPELVISRFGSIVFLLHDLNPNSSSPQRGESIAEVEANPIECGFETQHWRRVGDRKWGTCTFFLKLWDKSKSRHQGIGGQIVVVALVQTVVSGCAFHGF